MKQYQAFFSESEFQTTRWYNEDELDELYKLIGKLVVRRGSGKGIGVKIREEKVVMRQHTVWDDLADEQEVGT